MFALRLLLKWQGGICATVLRSPPVNQQRPIKGFYEVSKGRPEGEERMPGQLPPLLFDSCFPPDPLHAHLTIELRRYNMAARRRTAREFWDRMKFSVDAANKLIDKEGLD